MAIRAWSEGDIRLAVRLLQWAKPSIKTLKNRETNKNIELDAA